jgi:hypothetical protein
LQNYLFNQIGAVPVPSDSTIEADDYLDIKEPEPPKNNKTKKWWWSKK